MRLAQKNRTCRVPGLEERESLPTKLSNPRKNQGLNNTSARQTALDVIIRAFDSKSRNCPIHAHDQSLFWLIMQIFIQPAMSC